jgi:DNA topoisomerase-1
VPRLRRADCSKPGLRRRRAGRGFVYLDVQGNRVTDPDTLARIEALVIPPAWDDVWICPDPYGHLQATGVDAAGRRQYLYHSVWRIKRDRLKFDHMVSFGRALPAMRRRIAKDLARPELDRRRVLACATRLLDLGFFRIGTEGYAEQNQTYGLATIRKEHVRIKGSTVEFDYVAKSGKQRFQSIADPAVLDVVRALKRRRQGGPELLAYRDGDGGWCDVKSADINAYIKEITGGDFTAKDFRTWNATVLAAVALAVSDEAQSAAARKRAVARAFGEVSHYLGNTPAVCRASYVDPRVVDRYESGVTVAGALRRLGTQREVERAVLDLLDDAPAPALRQAG